MKGEKKDEKRNVRSGREWYRNGSSEKGSNRKNNSEFFKEQQNP